MNAEPSVLASWVLAIYRTIQSYGVDPDELLRLSGIDQALLRQHEARVPSSKSNILWSLAVEATRDPLIGLKVPDYMTLNTLYAVDAAAQASSTLREFLVCACRFSKVATTAVELSMEHNEENCVLRFNEVSSLPLCNEAVDAFMTVIFNTVEPVLQMIKPVSPFFVRVGVTRPMPIEIETYRQHFRCPIDFSCPENLVHMNPMLLDIQLPGANPEISRISEEMLVSYLSRIKNQDIEMKVRGAINDLMNERRLNKANVAYRLHMSERNLTRKLKDEEITFTQLVDSIRHEKAINLVKQTGISFAEIAFKLDFFDANSFNRAFRRWTGLTPGQYRSRIQIGHLSVV